MASFASTTHFFELSFKAVKSALFPSTKPKAPNKMDFPAPVSPVKALKPVIKFIEIFLINKKFLIYKDMRIEINLFFEFQNFLHFDH